MRRGALLNDAQVNGMLPTSVGGGENAAGNWSLIAGFCGPGSMTLLGFLALIAPCGGSFGLPKLISLFTGVAASAVVIVAAVTSDFVTVTTAVVTIRAHVAVDEMIIIDVSIIIPVFAAVIIAVVLFVHPGAR